MPVLPPFEQFWDELPLVLDWLYEVAEKPIYAAIQTREAIDETWQPPAMVQAWHVAVPLESVRFAAANRLCVNLQYKNSWRLIEPYSLRRSKDGNLLLCAVRHDDGEVRTYRVDQIQGVEVSKVSFIPKYPVELTPAGLLYAPEVQKRAVLPSRSFAPQAKTRSRATLSTGNRPTYVFKCGTCGKQFKRKSYDASMNPHKNKQGHPCYGSFGVYVKTEY